MPLNSRHLLYSYRTLTKTRPSFYSLQYLAKQLLNSEHLTIPNDSSGPEQDLDNPVLSHAAVTVSFDEDMQPGLTIKTRSTQQWTLIAAQTRARLRNS